LADSACSSTCSTVSGISSGIWVTAFEIKEAYRSGWIVVAVSLVATAISWIVGLRLI
jgi:hypothetical protein